MPDNSRLTKVSKKDSRNPSFALPNKEYFEGNQLDMFRAFLCNNGNERTQLSNTFDLWDSVPRYSISRQQMDKLRKEKGFLDLQRIQFRYRGKTLEAIIQATRIFDRKTGTSKDYYPSANEELVEDALRKIAAEERNAFFDKPNYRSGVVFSLHMLREELSRRGHSRSYYEIVLSLNILAGSVIEIHTMEGNDGESFTKSGYFSGLSAVSKSDLTEDPNAKWIVQFHPLVTQALDTLTYRQFNYAQMMSYKTQLARWLHKQLSLKFTFASLATSFEMRYCTIKRDSALLNGYTRDRAAIEALDGAFNELMTGHVLTQCKKNPILGERNKIIDIVYNLHPSPIFCHEMKAANKREKLTKPVDN
ncbi:replication protein [Methylovulum psychrotolerans]|uniref:Replication protein n=1 Tax=Methylovulum psychrotolerans TaxID=1704499 RepID=A0A2S5CFS0_9GAMM|nr:replication protein [Methylovulum psychrotolerans]POZ49582.1 replication protein [Methylovulum psychrotolerans]